MPEILCKETGCAFNQKACSNCGRHGINKCGDLPSTKEASACVEAGLANWIPAPADLIAEGECGLKVITLERTERVAKNGAVLICQQYEARHESEATP